MFLDDIRLKKGTGVQTGSFLDSIRNGVNEFEMKQKQLNAQKKTNPPKPLIPTFRELEEKSLQTVNPIIPNNMNSSQFRALENFKKQNPTLGKVLDGINVLASPLRDLQQNTTIGKSITRLGQAGADVVFPGAAAVGREKVSTGNKIADVGLDVAGSIMGLIRNPMAGIGEGGAAGQQAYRLLTQGIKPTTNAATPLGVMAGNRALQIGQLGAKGAGEGLPFALAQQLGDVNPDKTMQQRALEVGLDTALGATIEPLGRLASKGVSKVLGGMKKPSPSPMDVLNVGKAETAATRPTVELPRVEDKTVDIPTLDVSKEMDDIFGQLKVANNNVQTPLKADIIPKTEPPKPVGDGPGDAATFRSKVNRQNTGVLQKMKDTVAKVGETARTLRSQFVDDLAALEKLEKNINGSIASAEDSLYKQGRLFRGSPAKAHEIIRTQIGPVMDAVQSKGYKPADLGDYALAVHAKDVNAMGINSGFTTKEIDDVISKYADLETERKSLNQISKNMLENLSENGVISKELVEHLNQKYPNYMPLFRHFDDEAEFAGGLTKALANVKNPLERLKGSEREVIDPLESMVKNVFKATNAADRNRVATQLGKMADGQIVRKLSPEEATVRKNVVSVLENGKKVQYEVPTDVYRAMLNLDQESSNMLIKVLQKPASMLRAGATLTPEFSMRNWMRDVPTAFITSNSGFNPLIDFPVGLANAIGQGKPIKLPIVGQIKWKGKDVTAPGKWYHDYIMNNGGYGNIVSMDRKVHQESLEKVLKESPGKKFVNIVNPKKWLEVLQTIADISESGTKIGEFRAAKLKAKVSDQEAAYRARDIMDFGRSGSSIREANKVIAFLNANIQGKSKLYRAFKDNKGSFTGKSAIALTLPTMAVFYAQKEWANEEQKTIIKDAPDWMKNSFWLFPIPGTNQVARIPKPFDLSPLFANLPERMMEEHFNNNPQDWKDFAKESLSAAAVPVMLTGLMPFLEGMANYSFFRQGPIIPEREKGIEYPDQYDINTSEVAKMVGKGVNNLTDGEGPFKNFGSPRVIDNTIRGLTGGLGDYAVSGIDQLFKLGGMVKQGPDKPEKNISQQPLMKAFLANTAMTGQSMSDLYDEREKLTRAKGTAKERNQTFDERKLKMLDGAAKKIGDINKQMRTIQEDPKLDGSTKRVRLEQLNKQRNEIAREVMQKYKNN